MKGWECPFCPLRLPLRAQGTALGPSGQVIIIGDWRENAAVHLAMEHANQVVAGGDEVLGEIVEVER